MQLPLARGFLVPAVLAVSLIAVCPLALASSSKDTTAGKSTSQQTLIPERKGKHKFSYLKEASGERYQVRNGKAGLGTAKANRSSRRNSLVYFAQLSDFQLADPESPVRVETLFGLGRSFVGAWRPQEMLMPHLIDASIRQVNNFVRSPIKQGSNKRAKMHLAVLTGDNIDNQQRNEAEWMTQLIDGGKVKPEASHGHAHQSRTVSPACTGHAAVRTSCSAAQTFTNRYMGIQQYAGPAKVPHFYNPDKPGGPFKEWPKYPGLLDRAKESFVAAGLKVPSYVVLGNHDGLIQGNSKANAFYNSFAVSNVKPLALLLSSPGANAEELKRDFGEDPTKSMLITPDARREMVTKEEYKAILATKQRDAHGFGLVDPKELAASHGAASYYAWTPVRGVRFIAMDTISEAGVIGVSNEGNIDHPQYLWLKRELARASKRDELVVVTSHHGPESLTANVPDERAEKCTTPPGHRDPNPGCRRDPRRSTPIHLSKSITKLFLDNPNVVAWVSGHTHVNAVTRFKGKRGGFWGIRTSSEADWPHQSRLIEIMDNRDGTLSIFGTMLNDSSPVKAPKSGTTAKRLAPQELASIARTLGYNIHERGSASGGPGTRVDRNVELVIRDPRR